MITNVESTPNWHCSALRHFQTLSLNYELSFFSWNGNLTSNFQSVWKSFSSTVLRASKRIENWINKIFRKLQVSTSRQTRAVPSSAISIIIELSSLFTCKIIQAHFMILLKKSLLPIIKPLCLELYPKKPRKYALHCVQNEVKLRTRKVGLHFVHHLRRLSLNHKNINNVLVEVMDITWLTQYIKLFWQSYTTDTGLFVCI